MVTIQYRRLDKLRLLRRYTSQSSYTSFIESFGAANDCVKDGELKKIKEKYRTIFWRKFAGKGESTGLSFIFLSVQKSPAIGIDITPRKLSNQDWVDVRSTFDFLGFDNVWKDFRVVSVELALDVCIPFEELVFFAPGVKISSNTYLAKGTLYIGSQFGHRHFRIYDKKKHLAEVKKKHISKPLTRIEAIHQGLKIKMDNLHSIEYPFGTLIAVRKADLNSLVKKYPLDYEFRHFCHRISNGLTGHDAYWEQEPAARKRISKLLRPLSLNLNGGDGHWVKWITKQETELKQHMLFDIAWMSSHYSSNG